MRFFQFAGSLQNKLFSVKSLFFGLLIAAVVLSSFEVLGVRAAGNIGYKDFSMSGTSAPTGQKPQSKLWYINNQWWGIMYNKTSGKFEIYKFSWSTQSWSTTGTMVDSRRQSSADALWDGSKLYTVSSVEPGTSATDHGIKVMRFSYNAATQTYNVDSGFPVVLATATIETVVMDKDSTGKLWVTYTDSNTSGGRKVLVTHTTTNDLTWVTPYTIQSIGADNLSSDDISTLVAYNGRIGVMWSNQNTNTVYFATHVDGTADNLWTQNPALSGPHYADDHMNIKSLQADSAGQVWAAVKTSLNDVNPPTSSEPLILLLHLDNHGSWSRRTVARVSDNHTRPIVLLDTENRNAYVFMTYQYGTQTSGAIYYKTASLDNNSIQFPLGLGIPFIEFSTDTHINNISSTKQPLNGTTNLLAIAGDDTSHYYFHNVIDLPNSGPTATSTSTTQPTDTPLPTNTPLPTDTPTSTATVAPTDTPLPTNTATATTAPTDTPSVTDTPTETLVPTNTPLSTDTPTATATAVPANTALPTDTPTPTTVPADTATPTATASSAILFSDGFESGNFSAWSVVNTGGDGTASVQSSVVYAANFSAKLSETANTGSFAYARKSLSTPETNLTVSSEFMITQEGASGGNVPIFRLFDAAGTRLLTIYRQNTTNGQIWSYDGTSRIQASSLMPLNTWVHFDVHVITNGMGTSTIEVYMNGVQVLQTTTANLGTSGVLTIQIGNDTSRQTFTMFADEVLIQK